MNESQVVSDDIDGGIRRFRDAMRSVRRLHPAAAPPARPKPRPRACFTRADEADVLRESLLPPTDVAQLEAGDELSFRREHVPLPVLNRLRGGHYAVDAEIDLHGLTRSSCKERANFFADSGI